MECGRSPSRSIRRHRVLMRGQRWPWRSRSPYLVALRVVDVPDTPRRRPSSFDHGVLRAGHGRMKSLQRACYRAPCLLVVKHTASPRPVETPGHLGKTISKVLISTALVVMMLASKTHQGRSPCCVGGQTSSTRLTSRSLRQRVCDGSRRDRRPRGATVLNFDRG